MLGYLLSPVLQIEDTNGVPLVGGKIYVYRANTSDLATVYSNYEGTLSTNPVILDELGHATIIADDEALYDITVKDSSDNLIMSVEDVAVGGEGGSASVSDVTVRAGGNGIKVVQSVEENTKVFTVSIDYDFVASKTDVNTKQDRLTAGKYIDIDAENVISVTGVPVLSAGINIDPTLFASGYIDLKQSGCMNPYSGGIAIGNNTRNLGIDSMTQGRSTYVGSNVIASHAEGCQTSAFSQWSHAEGENSISYAPGAHAEGNGSSAFGNWSHAEGDHCITNGWHAHAEGANTNAYGSNSHAMGSNTLALGTGSLAAGDHTSANGMNQTVLGRYNNPNDTDIFQLGCGDPNNYLNAFELRNDKSMYYYYEGNMVRLAPFRRYIPSENFLLNGSTDLVLVDYSGNSDSFQILGNDSEIAMIWADNNRDGTVYVDASDNAVSVADSRVQLKNMDIGDRARIEIFGMGIGYYIPHWVYTIYRSTDRLHVYAEQVYDDIIE